MAKAKKVLSMKKTSKKKLRKNTKPKRSVSKKRLSITKKQAPKKKTTEPRPAKLKMLMIVPSARYFEWNASMVRLMTDTGRSGVYVSFHRPFKNVMKVLKHYKVNINKVLFVDVATGVTGAKKEPHDRCVHVAKADISEIDRAVHKSLKKLKGKKFIFVDSLTLASFYRPKNETRKLAKLLIEKIDNEHANYIIFSVAEELADIGFIRELKEDIDEVVKMP